MTEVDHLELVIITGMSGAGKTVAIQSFEDMGYFCIDNMPPSLIPKFWELIKESGKVTKIALVVDLRSRSFFEEIHTTTLTPRQLREKINQEFRASHETGFRIEILSFGFKYGLPIDADIVMDVRFLPNPHYIPELRPLTGKDEPVYEYVMSFPETEEFYQQFSTLLQTIMPGYVKEGKSSLTVAIGCTGGQHRSVALSERIGAVLAEDYRVNITHRDKDKRKETVNRS